MPNDVAHFKGYAAIPGNNINQGFIRPASGCRCNPRAATTARHSAAGNSESGASGPARPPPSRRRCRQCRCGYGSSSRPSSSFVSDTPSARSTRAGPPTMTWEVSFTMTEKWDATSLPAGKPATGPMAPEDHGYLVHGLGNDLEPGLGIDRGTHGSGSWDRRNRRHSRRRPQAFARGAP